MYIFANSANLPSVSLRMMIQCVINIPGNSQSELRNWKIETSSKSEYGDDSIGRVQLYRSEEKCFLKAEICPEHRVSSSCYKLSCVVNERNKLIEDINCAGCEAASSGSCKHVVAFFGWLYRRTEEKSPTEKICYWGKPSLLASSGRYKFSRIIRLNRFLARRQVKFLKKYELCSVYSVCLK